jgi:hypothetical protein
MLATLVCWAMQARNDLQEVKSSMILAKSSFSKP